MFSSTYCIAIDRMSHSSLLFKLKSICVGGRVLSICREFISIRRQRVVVDSATSECIPIVSGVPQGNVLGPLLFILYNSEVFELVENWLYAYADDSTLLAVACKLADRPAVAASLDRIQECNNHWCMILDSNKTKALVLVDPGLWTIHMVNWSCLGFPFALVPNSNSWREVWQQVHLQRPCAPYCLSCLSRNLYFEGGEASPCGHHCVTSLLLCICSHNPWILFSGVGVCCWMLSSAFRVTGVFGGQALFWPHFLVIVSLTSCCCTVYVVQG